MNRRIKVIGLIFLFSFVSIVLRLGFWQVVEGARLAAQAARQYANTLDLPASRGSILAGDGTTLAGSVPTYLLYAYKPHLADSGPTLVRQLTELLSDNEEDAASVSAELTRQLDRDSLWVPLARQLDGKTKNLIDKLGVAGLGFEPQTSRFYPDASSAAQLLGFVGSDDAGQPQGYFGLEGFYDRELRGSPGFLHQDRDAAGNPILVGSFQYISPKPGRSLALHLDRFVQQIVEQELKRGLERYGASAGEVMLMDPKSGAIIAAASFPNYDPSAFSQFDSQTYRNPSVSEAYEPGSTFKVLVMAAALEEDAVKPDTKCDICDGPIQIGKYKIRTWNGEYQENISMTDTIIHSDNTGMVFAAQKLGQEKLVEYLQKFGIGEKTGIDLQEETAPKLRDHWGDIDVATTSFGQGIAVTTVQMLRAVGTIANDGELTVPRAVAKVIHGDQEEIIDPKKSERVISKKTAADMTEMMVKAVIDGEAKFAAPKGYRIAGKTGTAQIAVAGHYDEEKTITSFVGFAPADDPKFVMITKLREPTSSPWGSETAAPLWFSIAKKLLMYWNIPPTEQ